MTQRLDSNALALLQASLSLSGGGAQTTELEDGHVQLVSEISHIVSAASPSFIDQGMVIGLAAQVHAGAGALIETVDLYGYSTAGNLPLGVGTDFDLWIHSGGFRTSAPANITGAAYGIVSTTTMPVISSDGSTAMGNVAIETWDNFGDAGADGGPVRTYAPTAWRLPRSSGGLFVSSVASGAATLIWQFILEFVLRGQRPSTF